MGGGGSGARHDLRVDAGDGLELNVVESGKGPALVLLHGFTGSANIWEPIQSALAPVCRTIAVDLAGHGLSSAPSDERRYDIGRFAGDLAHVLDVLTIEKAIVLGYSMGGRAALRFVLDQPDRVAGLILESASPGIDDPRERSERVRADRELADFIEAEGVAAFVERWETLPLWETQRSLDPERLAELRKIRLAGSEAGLANSLRGAGAGAGESMSERLLEIEAPVLLIAGEHDRKYAAVAAAMNRAIRRSRMAIIGGAGHTVHLEKPDAFASAVTDFVKEVYPV